MTRNKNNDQALKYCAKAIENIAVSINSHVWILIRLVLTLNV